MSILDRIRGKKEEELVKKEKPEAVRSEKARRSPKAKSESRPQSASGKAPEKKKSAAKGSPSKAKAIQKGDNSAYKNILSPLITEKSTILGQYNKYLFRVHLKANKREIKDAIEGYYGVNVIKVNVIKIRPKARIQGRTIGFKKGYKKAIITLKAGDTIGVAEGV